MSVIDGALADKKVLVTGATGFIGGRLAARLDREEAAVVTGTGRKLDDVPALAGTGVKLARADLQDADALRAALKGQQVVFHVAAWLGADRPNPDSAHAVNVEAVDRVLRLAAEAGVERLVHVSSVAVYGPPPDGPVAEDAPLDLSDRNDEYGRTKAQGEQIALRLGRELGLPVAVVRPGMVYGPGSSAWTVAMFKLVSRGVPVIFGPGDGRAGLVHVDNLVDLLLRAATRDEAVGHAFNAVDVCIPWRDFFAFYGAMAGRKPRGVPMWVARLIVSANDLLPLGLPLNRQRLDYIQARPRYLSDKAERELGWRHRVDLRQGMSQSEDWLRETGRLTGRRDG